mgnify:CR=1 FL=1
MIRVDLSSCNSFIPLPYEAALAPRLREEHGGAPAKTAPGDSV